MSVSHPKPEEARPETGLDVATVYTVIAARRTAFDTLMWQVPALGAAAQAFLLTIAFGSSSSDTSRYFAGGLSMVVALVAVQTMLKHRANELTDNLILEEIEDQAGLRFGSGIKPHDRPSVRGRGVKNDLIGGCWVRPQSARLWVASLTCFALAGLAAVLLTIVEPALLRGG